MTHVIVGHLYGKSPPHHQLICPAERIQMMNVQPTFQMIECDQDTANQHLAMAEMMNEDNVEQDGDGTPAEQDHLMKLSMVSGETYGNKDQLFSYSINDYGYYLNSFNSNVPAAEIDSIATNTQQIMGKNITNTQLVENQIVNILRSNSETSMMDHPQLIKFL